MAEKVCPKLLVEVQQDFGVGPGTEAEIALEPEITPEFIEIVDLAVVGDPYTAVFVGHGLVTGRREIDDAEPPMNKAARAHPLQPVVVGSAVGEN
jgi:hypothetical protein